MNWQLVTGTILGIIALYILCCMHAVVEAEIKKYREDKKWKDWANRRR